MMAVTIKVVMMGGARHRVTPMEVRARAILPLKDPGIIPHLHNHREKRRTTLHLQTPGPPKVTLGGGPPLIPKVDPPGRLAVFANS